MGNEKRHEFTELTVSKQLQEGDRLPMVASRIPTVGIVLASTVAEDYPTVSIDDGFEYSPNRCSWQEGGSTYSSLDIALGLGKVT